MYCRNYELPKSWLDKCLKSSILDKPLTSNLVNGPKHCYTLDDSTFTMFIDHCESNCVGKSLFQCTANSQDCLVTH